MTNLILDAFITVLGLYVLIVPMGILAGIWLKYFAKEEEQDNDFAIPGFFEKKNNKQ